MLVNNNPQNLMRVITGFHLPSYCEPQLPSSCGKPLKRTRVMTGSNGKQC